MEINQLRRAREKSNHTQKEICEHLGIKQQQYSRWELQQFQIPTDYLIGLAKFYKTSMDYIIGLTDDPTPPKSASK